MKFETNRGCRRTLILLALVVLIPVVFVGGRIGYVLLNHETIVVRILSEWRLLLDVCRYALIRHEGHFSRDLSEAEVSVGSMDRGSGAPWNMFFVLRLSDGERYLLVPAF